MKLIALKMLTVFAEHICPDGTSIGIDKFGNPRPSNRRVCFPTNEGARVTSCNNDAGEIELTAVFKGDFLHKIPDGFQHGVAGAYYRKFAAHELRRLETKTGVNFVTNVRILATPDTRVPYKLNALYSKSPKPFNIRFTCRIGLPAPKTLNSNQSLIKLKSTVENNGRKSRGDLFYKIVTDPTQTVGERTHFSVVPLSPDVMYAQVTKCSIVHDETGDSVTVFGADGNFCRFRFLDFQVMDGFGSQSVQTFSYQSFKWRMNAGNTEEELQTLECDVRFSMSPFEVPTFPLCDDTDY